MVSGLDSNPSHLGSSPIPMYFMLEKPGQALSKIVHVFTFYFTDCPIHEERCWESIFCQMTYFSSETRKIWSLSVWICPPEFLLMFYFNFQKCVSSPTRYERRRMSTFWCGWGLCLQSSLHKRTNHESNERWKTLKTVGNIKPRWVLVWMLSCSKR